jgi:GGDEF domain-containing protein
MGERQQLARVGVAFVDLARRLRGQVRGEDMVARIGGDDARALIRHADTAMYRAKQAGGAGYAFFH